MHLMKNSAPPQEAAFGIIGLETSVGLTLTELVHSNILSMQRAIELLSVNPRTIMNLEPISFKEGATANFTLIDPEMEWCVTADRLRSKSINTPFLGRTLRGKAIGILHKGVLHEA